MSIVGEFPSLIAYFPRSLGVMVGTAVASFVVYTGTGGVGWGGWGWVGTRVKVLDEVKFSEKFYVQGDFMESSSRVYAHVWYKVEIGCAPENCTPENCSQFPCTQFNSVQFN